MEKQILENYEINKHTLALLSAYHPEYDTIAIEPGCEWKIRKKPLQIIKQGCLEGGASYAGRREAVKYLTGAKNKVPIPVNPHEHIYAFPTHSPKQFECCWIFHYHIRSIKEHHFPNQLKGTMITFKNGQQVPIPVSIYTIEKQMQRTSQCRFRFTQPLFDFVSSYFSTEISY